MKALRALAVLAFVLMILTMHASQAAPAAPKMAPLAVFDRSTALVAENFYDRNLRGLPWPALVAQARARLTNQSTDLQIQTEVNGLLQRLHASHTRLYLNSEPEYWALQSVFSGQVDAAPTCQAGVWFERLEDRWFASSAVSYEARRAGLLPGDEIVSAGGQPFEPVQSFCGSGPARLLIRRSPALPTWSIELPTSWSSYSRFLLQSSIGSRQVLESGDRSIGYFHLWAGTHEDFRWALRSAVLGLSRAVHAFVLDLRGGLGGADPSFLDVFQNGYSGPLVVLIDGGTRSGKEWMAAHLKTSGRATLVGSRTAGAFLSGRWFEVEAGRSALYLAVSSPPAGAPDLEGKGVEPDINVPMSLTYSQGEDPQLVKALKTAAALSRAAGAL